MKINKTFILLHIALIIYSAGTIASKMASNSKVMSFDFFLYIGLLLVSLSVYAIIWQQVLKKLPLPVAFANKGITIIWGMLIGYFLFNEGITISNIIGTILVIIGIIVIVGADNE